MRSLMVRVAVLGLAAVAALTLGACAQEEADPRTCGHEEWCYGEAGAYNPRFAPFYCAVFLTRDRVATGEVDIADLPEWADATEREGVPVVVDLATVNHDGETVPIMASELAGSLFVLGHHREELRVERLACASILTQEIIEAVEGPRQDVGAEG